MFLVHKPRRSQRWRRSVSVRSGETCRSKVALILLSGRCQSIVICTADLRDLLERNTDARHLITTHKKRILMVNMLKNNKAVMVILRPMFLGRCCCHTRQCPGCHSDMPDQYSRAPFIRPSTRRPLGGIFSTAKPHFRCGLHAVASSAACQQDNGLTIYCRRLQCVLHRGIQQQ